VRCLCDTDISSEILKRKHPGILQRAAAYLRQYPSFAVSLMTRYEILRGLKAKNAVAQLAVFESWCSLNEVFPITEGIIVLAADLYGALHQTGQLIGDNDLIIAATALHHNLALATRNVRHFSRISGLTLDDWSHP
jgi:tRNA(fMet)-specific endonuclease VapC